MIISATDPAHAQASENAVEQAIGRQVRRYRKRLGLTITEMCERTGLSAGMVSKIENGTISPFVRDPALNCHRAERYRYLTFS